MSNVDFYVEKHRNDVQQLQERIEGNIKNGMDIQLAVNQFMKETETWEAEKLLAAFITFQKKEKPFLSKLVLHRQKLFCERCDISSLIFTTEMIKGLK